MLLRVVPTQALAGKMPALLFETLKLSPCKIFLHAPQALPLRPCRQGAHGGRQRQIGDSPRSRGERVRRDETRLEYGGFHRDERARLGFAVSHRFVADVHHARLAGTVVMGELAGHEEISYRERVSEFQKVAPASCRLEPA